MLNKKCCYQNYAKLKKSGKVRETTEATKLTVHVTLYIRKPVDEDPRKMALDFANEVKKKNVL